MAISLDPSDPAAPYEQIRRQVSDQVRRGTLAAGTKLPTVRGLAADLGLAANTVARAYRELEQAGVIETRGRAGSFVTGDGVEREARAAATAFVERLRELGVDASEAVRLVEGALRSSA